MKLCRLCKQLRLVGQGLPWLKFIFWKNNHLSRPFRVFSWLRNEILQYGFKLLTWFSHTENGCWSCHKAKRDFTVMIFCLVNDIATSQWYQLSGVWHFDLHLPALKTTELSVGLRLSQPRNQKLTKRQDHKSDERCHLLTIKSKPFFAICRSRIQIARHFDWFHETRSLVYRLNWQQVTSLITSSTYQKGFRLEIRMSLRHERLLTRPLKLVIHYKVRIRSSDKSFAVKTPECGQNTFHFSWFFRFIVRL